MRNDGHARSLAGDGRTNTEGAATERRSAWRHALDGQAAERDEAKVASDYYEGLAARVKQLLPWKRRDRDRALPKALKELREMAAADATEGTLRRYVAEQAAYVDRLCAAGALARCPRALRTEETALDGAEDVAIDALDVARASGDRTLYLNALDDAIRVIGQSEGVYGEVGTALRRERADVLGYDPAATARGRLGLQTAGR